MAIGSAALIIIGFTAAYMLWRHPKPPAGNDLVAACKYVSSVEFLRLAPEQRVSYTSNLREKVDEIQALYKDGKLTEPDYRSAMNAAWVGKQEEHVARYFSLAGGKPRMDYLDHLSRKFFQKKNAGKGAENFKHDSAYEDNYIADWSRDKQRRYQEFRAAYAERRKELEAAGKTTKPSKETKKEAQPG